MGKRLRDDGVDLLRHVAVVVHLVELVDGREAADGVILAFERFGAPCGALREGVLDALECGAALLGNEGLDAVEPLGELLVAHGAERAGERAAARDHLRKGNVLAVEFVDGAVELVEQLPLRPGEVADAQQRRGDDVPCVAVVALVLEGGGFAQPLVAGGANCVAEAGDHLRVVALDAGLADAAGVELGDELVVVAVARVADVAQHVVDFGGVDERHRALVFEVEALAAQYNPRQVHAADVEHGGLAQQRDAPLPGQFEEGGLDAQPLAVGADADHDGAVGNLEYGGIGVAVARAQPLADEVEQREERVAVAFLVEGLQTAVKGVGVEAAGRRGDDRGGECEGLFHGSVV